MKGETKQNKFSRLLKWIGYLTAILSFCATVGGVLKVGYDRLKTRRAVDSFLSAEAVQLQSRDYGSAWRTLEQASQLQPDSPKVRAAQESLAMVWLEDVHLHENQKFSDVTQKLEPVLTHAVAASNPGAQRADLRAHIGWAYFLASRDGRFDLDPAGPYAEAIAEDPHNPYAQAMWGHWILWQNCEDVSEAESHFASAMAAKRQSDYVRQLQLAALLNCHTDEAEAETVRVANAMRAEQRSLDAWSRSHIFDVYTELVYDPNGSEAKGIVHAVPPAEHLATFHWLFDSFDPRDSNSVSRTFYLAVLQEVAGQREDALASYRSVLAQRPPHSGSMGQAADAAVKRLSRSH